MFFHLLEYQGIAKVLLCAFLRHFFYKIFDASGCVTLPFGDSMVV